MSAALSSIEEMLRALRGPPPAIIALETAAVDARTLEAIHAVREMAPSTALLVLASDDDAESERRCLAAGAQGFLPVASADHCALLEAVSALARGEPFGLAELEAFSQSEHWPSRLPISEREREVLAYVAAGFDNLKIAAHLGICERTVKAHVSALYRKLGQENRIQLALIAVALGLRPPQEPARYALAAQHA